MSIRATASIAEHNSNFHFGWRTDEKCNENAMRDLKEGIQCDKRKRPAKAEMKREKMKEMLKEMCRQSILNGYIENVFLFQFRTQTAKDV